MAGSPYPFGAEGVPMALDPDGLMPRTFDVDPRDPHVFTPVPMPMSRPPNDLLDRSVRRRYRFDANRRWRPRRANLHLLDDGNATRDRYRLNAAAKRRQRGGGRDESQPSPHAVSFADLRHPGSPTTRGHDGPNRLDQAKRPRALQKSIDRRQRAGDREQQYPIGAPVLNGIADQHGRDREKAEQRQRAQRANPGPAPAARRRASLSRISPP